MIPRSSCAGAGGVKRGQVAQCHGVQSRCMSRRRRRHRDVRTCSVLTRTMISKCCKNPCVSSRNFCLHMCSVENTSGCKVPASSVLLDMNIQRQSVSRSGGIQSSKEVVITTTHLSFESHVHIGWYVLQRSRADLMGPRAVQHSERKRKDITAW